MSQCLVNEVVSIGRRNTRPKSYLRVFQWLNSFESVDSRKTLPWLGLGEYSPKVRFLRKTLTDKQIRRVLHRPVELAPVYQEFGAPSD